MTELLCARSSALTMVPAHTACALLSLAPLLVLGVPPIWTQPEQVHLSYPGKPRVHVFSFVDVYRYDFLGSNTKILSRSSGEGYVLYK